MTTILLSLDISSAFDTIDHSLLITRIKDEFGVTDIALKWLTSYLHSRKSFVSIGSTNSRLTASSTGVPQGSVLGPFLFSMFVSPIYRIIAKLCTNHHQYADDTQLYTVISPGKDSINKITECATAVTNWFLENGLLLNPNKTEAVLFGSRKQISKYKNDSKIAFSGTTLATINSVKILGVTLDSTLSMDKHINNTIKSCNYHIRALRYIRPCLTKEAANTIACGIVNSQLDYCNSLLSGTCQKYLKKLQRIQNNLSRIVFQSPFHLKSEILLKSLHWLPIHQRIIYKISVITYKILLSKSPAYLFELLEVRTSKQNTRSLDSCQLTRHQHKTSLGSKSFCMTAPRIWNGLSMDTRNSTSIETFKKRLKHELFINTFSDS
jgi:hypothetical protein